MKKVLAELHQLINSLEDHGLTAEASSLQEVFTTARWQRLANIIKD